MSGVGAFIVGAAVGAAVGKKVQKNHDKKHHNYHHQPQNYHHQPQTYHHQPHSYHQQTRTVVVHQPPQQVQHHQTHVVYVNNPSGAARPPQGYPQGHPPHAVQPGYPHGNPPQGYPPQPHYCPPQQQAAPVYPQSVPQSPGYPPAIGFVGSQASPYPPPAVHGGYPPAAPFDGYPSQQAPPFYPPTPSGYPSNGYPPMPGSSQYPPSGPLPPSVSPFQPPSAHPQPGSAAPAQAIQAHVTVQLTSNQQNSAGSNATARPDRRCFVLQNEETRYALQVDQVSGSKLVMRQRTATGNWDPQWSAGQGQGQSQGQLWYIDGEGILRSQLNDCAIEARDGGSWLCVAPYRGDPRQQWILREGRILSNKASPSECICLEEGLMGTAVNADVIVTQYQARRHHHWVVEYI